MADLEESEMPGRWPADFWPGPRARAVSVQIRNLATLGGNMAHGSPAADMATPLLALDAAVVMVDARGRRKLPLAEYLAHARHQQILAKSLLVEMVVPDPPNGKGCRWSFQKLGRTAVDISLVNVAAGLQLDSRGR